MNLQNEFTFTADNRLEVVDALKEIMLTPLGQLYKKDFYTSETGEADLDKILSAAQLICGGPAITAQAMAQALELLIDSGEIQPRDYQMPAELEEPVEDARPRDKNGKLLTQQQIAWGEYRQFAETASMDEVNRRKRTDPGFANFVRKNFEREATQEIGDAVVPVGDRGTRVDPTTELADFARKYHAEPVANLRAKGGFVTLAGEQIPYQKFLNLVNKASAIRLI